MTRRIMLLLAISFAVMNVGCTSEKSTEIHSIYVEHCHSGSVIHQIYKIDFGLASFYEYDLIKGDSMDDSRVAIFFQPESTSAYKLLSDGDFPHVSNLNSDSVHAFLNKCQEYGFTDWEDKYMEPKSDDGHYWSIIITYSDGTTQVMLGHNAYPETWDEMYDAFKELTDAEVLNLKNDWLNPVRED